jgi:hypothetical protein
MKIYFPVFTPTRKHKGASMGKRPNLAANVKAAAGAPPIAPVAQIVQSESAAQPETKRSSRAGRKAVYAWVDPAEHKKLKKLSLETERSIDALVTEAMHLLFDKHSVV